jgi:hypothetical protein
MPVRSQTRRGELGPKRTSRFVIILSLAVFDGVEAEGCAPEVPIKFARIGSV